MNLLLRQIPLPSGQILQLVQGDITAEKTDAIVNAANGTLQHAGGLARSIARRAGISLQKESEEWIKMHGPVLHAVPAVTSGGDLPAKYVIHAVGPVWGSGEEDSKLAAAVSGSLKAADELSLDSIALPAISTGIFGFPKRRAAGIIYREIEDHFSVNRDSSIKTIRLVLFDQPTVDTFLDAWNELWGQ